MLTSSVKTHIAHSATHQYTQFNQVERRSTVQQDAKRIADQVNKALNEMDVPVNPRERASILSKMLDIPKQQAWNLLEGFTFPDDIILTKITSELEIEFRKK